MRMRSAASGGARRRRGSCCEASRLTLRERRDGVVVERHEVELPGLGGLTSHDVDECLVAALVGHRPQNAREDASTRLFDATGPVPPVSIQLSGDGGWALSCSIDFEEPRVFEGADS